MNLNISQIREITTGAVRIEEIDNAFHFYRFTKQQEDLYKNRNLSFYKKTLSTSGVQIRFRTNSQNLFLSAEVSNASTRSYFSFEVFVNGKKIDDIKNFSESELSGNYTGFEFPLGIFSKKFDLGTSEKEVCIYFPWSVNATIKKLIIDDDSFVTAVKPSKKLLVFGDSVTQGYDALYPSNKYITQIANMLDAEEYNKAIGGEIYFPELAKEREAFEPNYIIVSYGSNDWNRSTKEDLARNCNEIFNNLNNNYPNAKIFVITPIWRKDMNEIRPFGDFLCVGEIIQKQAAKFANISVIHGFEFVPKNEDLFADLRLHPNDKGFEYYFKSLSKQINDIL